MAGDGKVVGGALVRDALSLEDRCVGSVLTLLIGDILGAGVEGWASEMIAKDFPEGVQSYFPAFHMGIEHLGKRCGMYTDDGNSALALAASLVENQRLDAAAVALKYSLFWSSKPQRGYPGSAARVLKRIQEGANYWETGTAEFPDGSFANGGAMRIGPVGLAFRSETDKGLFAAVSMAIASSHVHSQAVDGAFVIARGVRDLLQTTAAEIDIFAFLSSLRDAVHTPQMRAKIQLVIEKLADHAKVDATQQHAAAVRIAHELGGNFQLAAVAGVPVALWGFALHYRDPSEALIRVIGFGGDTDTTACMAGALLGALHGTHWIPSRWFDGIENGPRGRDFAVTTAKSISKLDLKADQELLSSYSHLCHQLHQRNPECFPLSQ